MCVSFKLFKELSNNNLEAYEQKPEIRLFGVCFGHQIICKALFEVSILLETVAVSLLLSASDNYRLPRIVPYLKIPLFPGIKMDGRSESIRSNFQLAFLLGLGR